MACAARRDSAGRYVPISAQNSPAWSRHLIDEAEETLAAAARLGRPARFQWLAAIQSAHARRAHDGHTDWPAIVLLYDALLAHALTTGARVARVAALAEIHRPAHALDALAATNESSLRHYQPYWALRAHLLSQLRRYPEAAEAYREAILLQPAPAVREFLTHQLEAIVNRFSPS